MLCSDQSALPHFQVLALQFLTFQMFFSLLWLPVTALHSSYHHSSLTFPLLTAGVSSDSLFPPVTPQLPQEQTGTVNPSLRRFGLSPVFCCHGCSELTQSLTTENQTQQPGRPHTWNVKMALGFSNPLQLLSESATCSRGCSITPRWC